MRVRRQYLILSMATLTLLGGCASNCNILSGSNSFGCDAMMMGGMILAAPIAGPAVLLSDAANDAKTKRMAKEWQSTMTARLADNDIEAIQECLQECEEAWKYDLDYAVRNQLQQDAAKRFLAGDWAGMERDRRQANRLLAHYILSWQPESKAPDARSALVPDEVRKSYTLAQDAATRAQLKKWLSSSRYNLMAGAIHGAKFAIDASPDESIARTQFQQCPTQMTKIIPNDDSFASLSLNCSMAYRYRFREPLPEPLRLQWAKDIRDNKLGYRY